MAGVLRPATLSAGLALFGLTLLVPLALARPPYREQAIRQFHIEGPTWSKKTMACTYCHVNAGGGAPWNLFGQGVRASLGESSFKTIDVALYDVLAAGQDADGDGYPDAVEVYARTLPGDPESHPTEALADLEQKFGAAGGVEQYRWKKGDQTKP